MTDKPFLITLEHVKEHENGDATYTFDMTETARDAILEDGLRLMLYCGVAKVDLQDVYDWILSQADEPKPEAKLPEGRHPLSDDWFREKAAAFSFDEYGYYGENNGPLPPTEDIRPMTKEERKRASEKAERNNHV